MNYKRLGRDGPKVSEVGLGTGQFGSAGWGYGSAYGDAQISDVIFAALDSGINLIDTSETYGNGKSEAILGSVLKEYKRDDYFIITKVAPWNLEYSRVSKAMNGSLKRLQLSYVDMYLVHYPNPLVRMRDSFRALERLADEGKTRYIGVSNFGPSLLNRAQAHTSKHSLVVDEIEYNLLSRRAERTTIPYCEREGIGVVAYSPLAGGFLTGKFSAESRPKGRARAFNFLNRRNHLLKLDGLFRLLQEIAKNRNISVPQVALAYLLRLNSVVPIPAALTASEARDNAGASLVRLTTEEVRNIQKLSVPVSTMAYFFDNYTVRPISWTKESLKHLRVATA